ncbi:hypothetical protein BH10PSE16_BH10PSE16_25940 [soil metagenome]
MTALDGLRHCPDVTTLKPALHRLCETFGRVARLDVLTAMHEGTRQAICFLRLDSPEQEQTLMQTLGVGRFGGEIVFVVNLNPAANQQAREPSSEWVDRDDSDAARLPSATMNVPRDVVGHPSNLAVS